MERTVPDMLNAGKDIPLALFKAFMEDTDPISYEVLKQVGKGVIVIQDMPRMVEILEAKGLVKVYQGHIGKEG